jgi:hypothetical protein
MATAAQIDAFVSGCGPVTTHIPEWSTISVPAIKAWSPVPDGEHLVRIYRIEENGQSYAKLNTSSQWAAKAYLESLKFDYDPELDCLVSLAGTEEIDDGWYMHKMFIYKVAGNNFLDVLLWKNQNASVPNQTMAYIWPRRTVTGTPCEEEEP